MMGLKRRADESMNQGIQELMNLCKLDSLPYIGEVRRDMAKKSLHK